MADRMAVDGTVRPLLASPDVATQFPTPCYMRAHLRSSISFYKVRHPPCSHHDTADAAAIF